MAAAAGARDVAMPDAAQEEPKYAAVFVALDESRRRGAHFVPDPLLDGAIALERRESFVATYGFLFEADVVRLGGIDELVIKCKCKADDLAPDCRRGGRRMLG